MAEEFSMAICGTNDQASEDWADTKAAYRFFDNPKATPDRIISPHREQIE